MAKPWDETMKKLIDVSPQQFIDWLVGGGTFLHFVPTELLKPKEDRVIQDMYDLVQQTPLYQSWTRRAREEGEKQGFEKGLMEGKEEGLKEGKLEGLRQTLVNIVRVRFPRLTSLARTQAAHKAFKELKEEATPPQSCGMVLSIS